MPPFQGFGGETPPPRPRALPWAPLCRPFGAPDTISGTAALPAGTTLARARDRRDTDMATAPLGTLVRHIQELAVGGGVPQCTDRQLLGDFAARRHEVAFTALVSRHGPLVLRVFRRAPHHE